MSSVSTTSIHMLPQLWKQYVHDLHKHRWLSVFVAWVFALVAVPIVLIVPSRYEASARIFVDTQTVLKPLLAGLAFQPDLEQQVRMLARAIISRPNIEALISRPELAPPLTADREQYIQKLMQQIRVESAGGSSANFYSIIYRDSDRPQAKRVVEATVDLFVQSSFTDKKRDSDEASQFIDEQIKTYESKLEIAEDQLKKFKIKNFGVSGVSNQDYFARISALSEEVSKLQSGLGAAEQSRDTYRKELSSESPQLPQELTNPNSAPVASELDTRLESQRKQLDELLRRYTDEHPDVLATRRVIAQLEAQRRREIEEKAAAEKVGPAKAAAATSPVYQKIRVALAETEAQVASLRAQLSSKRASLDQLRAVAGRVPQVEAEFAQLNRDYEVIRKNYDTLVARRESAAIGRRLDESTRGAAFRIIEPPRVSPTPVFPARTHVAAGAALMALLAGLLSPLAIDLIRPTFKNAKALRTAIARPLLGSVSIVHGPSQLRGSGLGRISMALALVGLVLFQASWLVWLTSRSVAA